MNISDNHDVPLSYENEMLFYYIPKLLQDAGRQQPSKSPGA
ncbi:hypothetical protein YPPY64_4058 [Yersinia pestis PY-64]|nr:hypothetical protein YPPY01_3874 [Yersinia pestis PY-01]EIQ85203.1 hypothetical protein YPPY02_3926 [Yersinia pestis PY-02]EIR29994.1 hypothetical protein YPPY12_4093 [Yersinia pestis PY-12]EIR71042.1 hypothetical protein YPPY29_3775 [Yersinia pestis PY-29]EIR88977.1 hypothetical protein YPPY45_3813 [Yersinia pestis PY-45]EIS55460.1 hypothetical protein YPPY64_4058 [Yersinia pestis PY-64]EIT11364.1 hypothetical protein YPPY92_3963 [Yersinia pestis PY-92]EIT42354.1 hypothetical protein YPP